MRKTKLRKILIVMFALLFVVFISSCTADKPKGGVEGELNELIEIVNSKQVTPQEMKTYEDRLKSYFFEIVEFDVIERLIKELSPGKALTVIVFTSLSKTTDKEIVEMMKQGNNWTEISNKTGVKLEDVTEKIKHYRVMSGCA